MSKHPRVKEVLLEYQRKGMAGVARYLSDNELEIDPSTWTGKMKRLLDSNSFGSMEAEIASVYFVFNLSEKDERRNNSELQNSGPGDIGDSSDSD